MSPAAGPSCTESGANPDIFLIEQRGVVAVNMFLYTDHYDNARLAAKVQAFTFVAECPRSAINDLTIQ